MSGYVYMWCVLKMWCNGSEKEGGYMGRAVRLAKKGYIKKHYFFFKEGEIGGMGTERNKKKVKNQQKKQGQYTEKYEVFHPV